MDSSLQTFTVNPLTNICTKMKKNSNRECRKKYIFFGRGNRECPIWPTNERYYKQREKHINQFVQKQIFLQLTCECRQTYLLRSNELQKKYEIRMQLCSVCVRFF